MKVIVQVTQTDIDQGQKGRACKCPVALAIRRHLSPTQEQLFLCGGGVTRDAIFWQRPGDKNFTGAPKSVYYFVKAFDNGDTVSPIEFELEIPDEPTS